MSSNIRDATPASEAHYLGVHFTTRGTIAPVAGLNMRWFVTRHRDSITPEWEEMWITVSKGKARGKGDADQLVCIQSSPFWMLSSNTEVWASTLAFIVGSKLEDVSERTSNPIRHLVDGLVDFL